MPESEDLDERLKAYVDDMDENIIHKISLNTQKIQKSFKEMGDAALMLNDTFEKAVNQVATTRVLTSSIHNATTTSNQINWTPASGNIGGWHTAATTFSYPKAFSHPPGALVVINGQTYIMRDDGLLQAVYGKPKLLSEIEEVPTHKAHATICTCGCDCEPDGDWHFNGKYCACQELGCACVVDSPGKARHNKKVPQDRKRKALKSS